MGLEAMSFSMAIYSPRPNMCIIAYNACKLTFYRSIDIWSIGHFLESILKEVNMIVLWDAKAEDVCYGDIVSATKNLGRASLILLATIFHTHTSCLEETLEFQDEVWKETLR